MTSSANIFFNDLNSKMIDHYRTTFSPPSANSQRKRSLAEINGSVSAKTSGVDFQLARLVMGKEDKDAAANPPVYLSHAIVKQIKQTPCRFEKLDRKLGPVINQRVQDWLKENSSKSKGVMISVLAAADSRGGGRYHRRAQEESLVQCTPLLYRMPAYPKRDETLEAKLEHKSATAISRLGDAYVTPSVPLYEKSSDDKLREVSRANYVFTAALSFAGEKSFSNRAHVETPAGRQHYIEYMTYLIRLQCEHALESKSKLIAGDFGCGAFNNNPILVASLYRAVLSEDRYKNLDVDFVIYFNPDAKSSLPNLPIIFDMVFAAPEDEIRRYLASQPAYLNNEYLTSILDAIKKDDAAGNNNHLRMAVGLTQVLPPANISVPSSAAATGTTGVGRLFLSVDSKSAPAPLPPRPRDQLQEVLDYKDAKGLGLVAQLEKYKNDREADPRGKKYTIFGWYTQTDKIKAVDFLLDLLSAEPQGDKGTLKQHKGALRNKSLGNIIRNIVTRCGYKSVSEFLDDVYKKKLSVGRTPSSGIS